MRPTYHIVLDSVKARVGLVAADQAVLDIVDAEDANLLESPAREAARKLLVLRLGLWAVHLGDLCVEPLVLEHGGSDDGHAGRVACLEGRDEGELPAGGEELIRLDGGGLLLGVVAVGGVGGAEDGRDEVAVAEDVASGVRDGDGAAGERKVGLDARAGVGRRRVEDEHVVRLGGRDGVVVEVVDDGAGALGGQGNVELREQRHDGARRRRRRGQADHDVALGVDEVNEQVRGQIGAESCLNELAIGKGGH